MWAPSTFRRAGGIPVAIRAFILGGILIGLWLGLRLTGLEGRVRTVTWLAIAVPPLRMASGRVAVRAIRRLRDLPPARRRLPDAVGGRRAAGRLRAAGRSGRRARRRPRRARRSSSAVWRSQRARRSPCLERARDRRPPRRDRDRRADHERPAGGRNAEHRDQKPSPGDDPRLRRAAVAHPPRTVAPAATGLCAPSRCIRLTAFSSRGGSRLGLRLHARPRDDLPPNRLHLDVDVHAVAHHHAAGLEHHVPIPEWPGSISNRSSAILTAPLPSRTSRKGGTGGRFRNRAVTYWGAEAVMAK